MTMESEKKALDRAFLIEYLDQQLRQGDSVAGWLSIMSDELKKLSPEELLSLQIDVLRRLDAAITEERRARGSSPQMNVTPSPAGPMTPTEVSENELCKLPLAEAAIRYLGTCKKPQTPRQIWAVLEKAGRKVESDDPVKSVIWALNKIRPAHNDLVHIGFNRWHLRSRHKGKSLEKLLSMRAGKGGRTKPEHAKATKAGMKKAKANGTPLGRPSSVTQEQIETAKKMVRDGISLLKTSRHLGISMTVLRYNGVIVRKLRKEASKPAELNLGEPQEADNLVRFAKN